MKKIIAMLVMIVAFGMVYSEEVVEKETIQPKLRAARAVLTTAVENREPVDKTESFYLEDRGYLFSEIRDGKKGDFVYHVWYWYKGEKVFEMARVKLNVGGSRWRTWSSKYLGYPGKWVVEIIDYEGNTISTNKFKVSLEKRVDDQ